MSEVKVAMFLVYHNAPVLRNYVTFNGNRHFPKCLHVIQVGVTTSISYKMAEFSTFVSCYFSVRVLRQ